MDGVDFGLTALDYARYRAGFPNSLFERLAAHGIGLPGQAVVDLGTGTGALARSFARRGCRVIGIDPSQSMLDQARQLTGADEGHVEYRLATAENTGLPPGSADVVAAGQCWHWFDRPQTARECARILRPAGFVLVAHFDWLPLAGNLVEATEKLVLAYNPSWNMAGGSGLYPAWLRDLAEAGFRNIESFSYDVDVPYSPEAWRGRIRASAGVGASLPPEQVAAFDRDLAALLAANFPGRELHTPHRVYAVWARPPTWTAERKRLTFSPPCALTNRS